MAKENKEFCVEEIKKLLDEVIKEYKAVVCFVGPKFSGKTTACGLLQEGFEAPVLAFAEELKKIVTHAFDFTKDDVGINKEKEFVTPIVLSAKHLRRILGAMEKKLDEVKPGHGFSWRKIAANMWEGKAFKTPRQILQWVGTEFMHTVMPTFHCDVMAGKMKKAGIYFIDDLRFVTEFEFLKKTAPIVKVIKITGRNESASGKEEHSSEADWKNIPEDYKVLNNGTLPQYNDRVKSLFKKVVDDIYKEFKEGGIELTKTVDNIIGETNVDVKSTESGIVKVGKFIFKKIKGN